MNHHAELLGMSDSAFMNTTGLPADTYNDIRQHNRNSLLWRDESVDGLKTGHTDAAGYCLVTSAERSGMRLISVVTGMASTQAREDGSQALLNYGFRFFETHKLYTNGEEVTTARVWGGDPQAVSLGLSEDLHITVPRGRYDALEAMMDLELELTAPLAAGVQVGEVRVTLDDEEISTVPLVTLDAIAEASLWTRIVDEVTLWLQ
jgi:D-alanyl-D-alanine carboxypeptidase (penicillin-binding protein 5/6)